MLRKKTINTRQPFQLIEITDEVREIVEASSIKQGLCIVHALDIDTGILITSFYDPKGHEDILDDWETLIPARNNFHFHGSLTEGAAHVKSAVGGVSRDLIIENGTLELGGSQGIFFAEYNGPRHREYHIKVLGEK